MGIGDFATWAAAVIALLVGIAGLIFGISGQKAAKKANEVAENANSIARQAAGEAVKANEIAENANQLSEQANSIAGRALAKQTDDSFVDWEGHWDRNGAGLILTNNGSHDALDTTILVTTKNLRETGAFDNVSAGLSVPIPCPQIRQDLADRRKAAHDRFEDSRRSGRVIVIPSTTKSDLKVVVAWKTHLGFPERRELDITAYAG